MMPEDFPDLRGTHHGRELRPIRIPLQRAIEQVAAQTGLSLEKVSKLASAMRMGQHPAQAGMVGAGLESLLRHAAAIERGKDYPGLRWDDPEADPIADMLRHVREASERVRQMSAGHSPAAFRPYVGKRTAPKHANDQRTIRLMGKPYHLAQTDRGLRIEPGETPWN